MGGEQGLGLYNNDAMANFAHEVYMTELDY
jgi:hypothetical protein